MIRFLQVQWDWVSLMLLINDLKFLVNKLQFKAMHSALYTYMNDDVIFIILSFTTLDAESLMCLSVLIVIGQGHDGIAGHVTCTHGNSCVAILLRHFPRDVNAVTVHVFNAQVWRSGRGWTHDRQQWRHIALTRTVNNPVFSGNNVIVLMTLFTGVSLRLTSNSLQNNNAHISNLHL